MAYKNGSIQTGFQDIQVYTVDNDATLQRLPSFDPANRVTLSWHNINAFAKPKQRRCWNCKSDEEAEERKQILKDVNGEVQPGHLLAIMGASGAGKTTLLNTLTARNLRRLDVTGEVLVNDQNVGENMARVSAYVQQDDLFVGTLTVREHLVFQALLRMDKHLTYQERMKRVGEVILELGLSKCEDTIIGIAGRIKGISGGEAKRLAFAAEVLTNPSLMFCDEPTSGLDSFMSQSIISVLRNMAEGGRTIVCTIHQPSSEVFEMFDQLLLLAEGRVAYLGKASKATAFFERAGLRCPINYNPADFFIHNLAIVPGREDECKRKVQAICSQFTKEGLHINSTTSTGCSFTPGDVTYKSRYKASWCKQFRAVMWRSWISMIREPMLTKVRFFQTLIIALLLGLIYLRQDYDQKGIMNLNGALFLALTNVTFQNMFSVVNAFCLEQPIFLREHWNGMYRTDVYFICKTLAEAPILMMMTVMFITILYWMVGLNPDYKAFLISLAIFILIANTAASFGYMISCLANTLNIALSISTPLLMPLLLFGGFYLNNASVPDYFIWIKYISWFYYGNEALCINQWSSITNITCPENPLAPCMSTGETVIASLNFEKDYFERDIGLVVALFVFFRVLAFIALLIKSSRKT
ncbi:protein white-like [Uloborus diversus]|uniref:protein white-like n=1 Tax=Uloborus diversus TaxID=327109 RepID=UPI00240A7F9D|nr:protein white-like [Uloborus diversus]